MTKWIAEAGNCDDSLQYAHEAVEAAADAGVDYFKVQMYRPDRLTQRNAARYDHLPGPAENQYELFENALPYAAWAEVQAHCNDAGLVFFASVFDEAAIDWCEDMDVPLYKVASGDITHMPLLDSLAQTGKPVLFSTGGSYASEILRAAGWLGGRGIPMACTLTYPCPPGDAQTLRVTTLLEHFDVVGYSDHTKGLAAPSSAAGLGAEYIECHFTVRPGTGGDHNFAKTERDMRALVNGEHLARSEYEALFQGDGVLAPQPSEMAGRTGARRSIVAKREMPAGHVVTFDDLDYLRPGGDREPWQWEMCLGELSMPMDKGQPF